MTKKKQEKPGQESSATSANARQYNWIYEKLVNEPDDVVGLIAYGLYKRRKIEFISQYKAKNERDPSDYDLEQLHLGCQTHVQDYRDLAETKMRDAFQLLYEDTLHDAQIAFKGAAGDLKKKHDNELKERLKGTFKSNFWTSVLAGLMSTMIVGLVALAWIGHNPKIALGLQTLIALLTPEATN